jgi:hypothetical protein
MGYPSDNSSIRDNSRPVKVPPPRPVAAHENAAGTKHPKNLVGPTRLKAVNLYEGDL